MSLSTERWRIRVTGTVQGVGLRPYVYQLATRCDVTGFVSNDDQGVLIEAEGSKKALGRLVQKLREQPPLLATVERIDIHKLELRGDDAFIIAPSGHSGSPDTAVPPDAATCDECLAEVFDPKDRRYAYPFISCTNCGPRFTIVSGVPYDRQSTTMASFPMCPSCQAEYDDPRNRRFHAQPNCCHDCGPQLSLTTAGGEALGSDPLKEAASLLGSGGLIAVKGLGGYHLAAAADDEGAVSTLRRRKAREEKPFAVMAADVVWVRRLVIVDSQEESLLTSSRRPIVLLRRLSTAPVAGSVAPRNGWLGVMLPYTALHHLLIKAFGRPIVLTSGNVSNEPIAFEDAAAKARLGPIVDGVLTHDRPIRTRTDDSVVRVFRDRPLLLRRSRGYVPQPLNVGVSFRRPVLALGAELKNTFSVGHGDHVSISHHIGDLENYETLCSFIDGIGHFCRLLEIEPHLVAHDLHPEYLSTKYAFQLETEGTVQLIGVQHHHAHVASCLADNRATGPVIGMAFDGLGYGTDGALWGGEVLVADLAGFERLGHLAAVPMPGGAAAIRHPWRMAVGYLGARSDGSSPDIEVARRHGKDWVEIAKLATVEQMSPPTSSMGRLFDAMAAVVGVRDSVSYEGQAAIELEQRVDVKEGDAYAARLVEEQPFILEGGDFLQAASSDIADGQPVGRVAAKFHNGIANSVSDMAELAIQRTGLSRIALSGGVFQNMVLLDRCVRQLEAMGLQVLTHQRVPPNDGGLSVGQAAVAGFRDAR